MQSCNHHQDEDRDRFCKETRVSEGRGAVPEARTLVSGKDGFTEGGRPWRWQGGTQHLRRLIRVKRNVSPLPVRWKEGWTHSGSMLYSGSGFLLSCLQNHFLLSKMLTVIFRSFGLGGIISDRGSCLQESRHSAVRARGWFALGRVPRFCCHAIL